MWPRPSTAAGSWLSASRCRIARERRKPPGERRLPYSGGGIRTRDLRVMSPTSYLTAPPRGVQRSLPACRGRSTPVDEYPQPLGVPRAKDLPVVVEVGEALHGLPPVPHA